MKLLRLILNQNKAAYAVEEMAQNIGTYPLPQLSTVIGMLCAAHKELDLSGIKLGVQGRYRSKRSEMHMRTVHLDIAEGQGTVYYLSKRYMIVKNKRVFERVPCLLTSKVPLSDQMLVDEDGYLVDLN